MECNYVLVLGYKASSEDDEDEVISPSEDTTKPFGYDENKPEGGEDEEMVGRYFETLGTSSPAQKADEQVTEPPPLDTDRLMRTRLSISARFLSRSHQPGRFENMYCINKRSKQPPPFPAPSLPSPLPSQPPPFPLSPFDPLPFFSRTWSFQ